MLPLLASQSRVIPARPFQRYVPVDHPDARVILAVLRHPPEVVFVIFRPADVVSHSKVWLAGVELEIAIVVRREANKAVSVRGSALERTLFSALIAQRGVISVIAR